MFWMQAPSDDKTWITSLMCKRWFLQMNFFPRSGGKVEYVTHWLHAITSDCRDVWVQIKYACFAVSLISSACTIPTITEGIFACTSPPPPPPPPPPLSTWTLFSKRFLYIFSPSSKIYTYLCHPPPPRPAPPPPPQPSFHLRHCSFVFSLDHYNCVL